MTLSSCITKLCKRKVRPALCWLLVAGCGLPGWSGRAHAAVVRSWNDGWRFVWADEPGEGADWREVRVPHDWSAEHAPEPEAAVAGHGGFAVTGVGWYERRFEAPREWAGQRVTVHFEGVYGDADLWLNGVRLSRHRYGHLPWRVELTAGLRLGEDNVLRLRVNNADQPNARWYTGSGLLRPVWIEVRNPVYVVPDSGVTVTRSLTPAAAVVDLAAEVANMRVADATVVVEWMMRDPAGVVVATARRAVRVGAQAAATVPVSLTVPAPRAWTPAAPQRYTVAVRLTVDGHAVDRAEWTTGLRTVRVSAERGFELNGEPLKLLGGNVHADHGILGAMSLARAEERKVEGLKAAGFNAVRTAHHPPAPAFLEACDRLGLLVVDELYDGWVKQKTKQDYGRFLAEAWPTDVATWIRRDRRHPSVVLWSVGNEMYERNSASGRDLATKLVEAVHRHDGTRPVTAGVNGPGGDRAWSSLDALFGIFDVAGYNYELAAQHAADHVRVPDRIMFAAESYQQEAFTNWAIMREAPYVIGDFVWSAQDYLGEAGIGRVYPAGEEPRKHWEGSHWPWRGSYCGDLDLIGWRKPISHYRQIIWDAGERLYVAVEVPSPDGQPWQLTPWSITPELPSWTWPGHEGQALQVNVASRWPRVRLLLNETVIGELATGESEAFRATFAVPYAPGELVAIGLNAAGKEAERQVLRTAGPMTGLRVTVDRDRLHADGDDLAYVEIESVDAHDVGLTEDTRTVRVTVEGPGRLVALGSGDPTAPGVYSSPERKLWLGRLLAVVRTTETAGEIRVRVNADGVPEQVVRLRSERREEP